MSALTPERPQSIAGRSALRRKCRYVFMTMLIVLSVGCRTVGTPANRSGVTSISDDETPKSHERSSAVRKNNQPSSTAKRSTLSSSKSSTTPSERVNTTVVDEETHANRTSPDREASHLAQTQVNAVFKTEDPDDADSFIKLLSFQDDKPSNKSNGRGRSGNPRELPPSPEDTATLRLTFPPEIPGATAPMISLPETDDDHPGPKLAAIDFLFPRPVDPKSLAVPDERAMALEELEDLALQNSPIIAQSLAGMTMSQGTAIQQGIYPNPVFGYESDTVGSSFTRDYQGVYVSQLVKTGGKLTMQRAAANMDVMNSQLAYERTKLEVLRTVRAGYYNVLVAQEAMRINEALLRFTDQVYTIMIDRLKNGQQAAYELSQLQSLVIQARGAVVQSQNRYISAWKQLAIATGVRDLRPAPLEGRVDMPVPNLDFDALLERALLVHPDVQASRNMETQSKIQLRLQRTIPIPDVTVAGALQNDSTTPGYQRTSYNLNVSVPVPLWDRNQGNIKNALGKLQMNSQQFAVTTNQLTNQLADAFERYQTGRVQAEYYRTQILPDLARAYRGVYERHISNSQKVAFGDIIVAQQNLAGGVSNYVTALLTQWIAMTDIANLIQAQDFREMLSNPTAGPEVPAVETPLPSPREGGQP